MASELHVLIVDQNASDIERLLELFAQAGCHCFPTVAETYEAFRGALAQQIFDIVLCDYTLPDFNGLRALREVRERDADLPFILIAHALGEEKIVECFKAGLTDYVAKTQLHRLGRVVARALRARREQQQRQQAEEALRRAEARYRDLFENANDMIYTRDLNGCFTSVNSCGERLTGYTAEEFLGMHVGDLFAPEYLHLCAEELLRARSEAELAIPEELEFITKTGERVWVEVSSRLIFEDGEPVGVQGIARDISDRQRARQERKRLEYQLLQSQKLESIGTLAGGIAHDFNNMLTVIMGNVQMALENNPPNSADNPLLIQIEQAAIHATQLTRHLLTFSRRQPIERRLIDLNGTIRDLLRMLMRIIGEDVAIDLALAPELPRILADPAQIQQVLMNLAVNARDAMPGGGRLQLTTDTVRLPAQAGGFVPVIEEGYFVRLVVGDTGVGIDTTTQLRIFEPFFTTKEHDRGTGLGLSVVYGIVQQHGGAIGVESAPGHGATFTIVLPLPTAPELPEVASSVVPVRGGTETILVAEDDPALRRMIAAMLERLGYTVIQAEDGLEALECFQANPARIDLALLDLVMPHFSGRDAFKRMRTLRPGIRALFVTGYGESLPHQQIREEAPAGTLLLYKPYRLEAISAHVRALLDQCD